MMIELSQHLEMGLSDFVHMLVRLSQFGTYLIFVKKVELSGKPFPRGYIVQTKISSKICRVSLFYSNITILTLSDARPCTNEHGGMGAEPAPPPCTRPILHLEP